LKRKEKIMKKKRHVSEFGFIVSTLGAAIGLGNV